MTSAVQTKKYLIVFDFDNTIISKNTDGEIVKAQSLLGQCIAAKNFYTNAVGWATSMSYTLKDLYVNSIYRKEIEDIILRISLIEGMKDVFDILRAKTENHQIVLLSHSNKYFIELLLTKFDLKDSFDIIYTYDSEWIENGEQLIVHAYDIPDTCCDLCPIDFCKGVCMETHLEKMNLEKDIKYTSVVYIGDGAADFCAALILSENDFVLARKDFSLHRRIVKDNGKKLKAKSMTWETGFEVLDFIRKLLEI